jgi:hypothetical protein
VEAVMYQDYNLGWENLPEQEEIEFVNEIANLFEDTIKSLYKIIRNEFTRDNIT